jgi:hypothetical protein
MRLFKSFSWVLLYGTFAFVCAIASAQTGARSPGRIVVAKAIGKVTATNLTDKSQRALVDNDVLTQNYAVATGAESRAVLVFANGATINLGSDATLSIEEFLQDPFDEKVVVSDLTEEPSTSVTRLNLARGELVGNVKHLKREKGSSFIVNTPVGAAGIRGTTFRIVFRPDASGRVTFTLSTSEGAILFEAPQATGVSVETGKEVTATVEVTVDAANGTVTVNGPATVSAPQDIPAVTQATIATAAQQIIEASKDVILSTTPAATSPTENASPTKPAEDTKAENQTQPETTAPSKPGPPFTPNENAAPVINTPQPDVTPGAGN